METEAPLNVTTDPLAPMLTLNVRRLFMERPLIQLPYPLFI